MEIGRFQPLAIIGAAVIGIVLGTLLGIDGTPAMAIEIPLMALLFLLFLGVDLGAIKKSLSNFRFAASALALNFVLTPCLAFGLGLLFFGGEPDIRIGLIMLLATPCTDWYLVFTGMSRGNVELGLSILPLNLTLQIALMPVYLFVFMGSEIDMDVPSLLWSMVMVLAIPFVLALVVKRVAGTQRIEPILDAHGDNLQILFLCIAVAVMFAGESRDLLDNTSLLLEMFIPLMIFFASLLTVSQLLGRAEGFPYPDCTALSFTSLARNSPLSLAIAVAAFPDQPLISLALVIGPLIELPILSLISWALLRTEKTYRPFGKRHSVEERPAAPTGSSPIRPS